MDIARVSREKERRTSVFITVVTITIYSLSLFPVYRDDVDSLIQHEMNISLIAIETVSTQFSTTINLAVD